MSVIKINQDKLKEIRNEQARANREAAFRAEHDPLAMKYMRGEDDVTLADLQALAADIRARFPYQD